jgi:hypothetical protein
MCWARSATPSSKSKCCSTWPQIQSPLNQGEYKAAYDKASRVSTYQIILPVKGAYQSIWQFAMQGLRAMPYVAG